MSEPRICPECGSDVWKARDYDSLLRARDRHHATNRQQAIEILALKLRVAELEERERDRGRKVQKQSRIIRRLEERLRAVGSRPYEGEDQEATT